MDKVWQIPDAIGQPFKEGGVRVDAGRLDVGIGVESPDLLIDDAERVLGYQQFFHIEILLREQSDMPGRNALRKMYAVWTKQPSMARFLRGNFDGDNDVGDIFISLLADVGRHDEAVPIDSVKPAFRQAIILTINEGILTQAHAKEIFDYIDKAGRDLLPAESLATRGAIPSLKKPPQNIIG